MSLLLSLFLGLAWGSFLNVFAHRWPQTAGAEIVPGADKGIGFLFFPLSSCPRCGARIKPWHNVPVLSYLWLRGRCASCKAAIPVQYPLVELATGLLAMAVVARHGWGLTALAAMVFASALLALSLIDIRRFVIADRIVVPLVWVGLLANLDSQFATVREAVVGAALGYLFIYAVRQAGLLLTRKEMIGLGDAKLMAAAGAWLGYHSLPFVLFIGSVLGLAYGVARLAVKGYRKRYRFLSFGPFLSVGALAMLFWGDEIRYRYLELVGAP